MRDTRRTNTPTRSRHAPRSVRHAPTGWCRRGSTPGSTKSAPAGATATTIPIRSCMSVFKDGVPANTHFLNVLPDGATAPPVDRIPLYEVYMRMAEELAKRSTCARLQVGTVKTDQAFASGGRSNAECGVRNAELKGCRPSNVLGSGRIRHETCLFSAPRACSRRAASGAVAPLPWAQHGW